MKKLNKNSSIFSKIFKVIDKYIIVPITKFIVLMSNKAGKSSKWLENWLSKTNTLLFISLFLAVLIFVAIDQKILLFSESSAEVLKKQKVNAIYNEEAYVVEGLPETVDITLIGSKTDLYIAKQSPTSDVEIDLSGYREGTYKVDITYNNVSSLEYSVNPSFATVTIYPKVSKTKTLTIDILNQDNLDSTLVVKDVTATVDEVVIKGAEYKINTVATVKALVDINNLVKQEIGTFTLKDVPLKAYDEQGNVVDVQIVPSVVDAEVTIASPSKDVPIKVIPKGSVAFGWAISAISTSETKVTVYGSNEILEKIEYLPLEVDVTNLQENKEYKVELTKPNGIKAISITNVNVNVSVTDEIKEKNLDVNIEFRNLKSGYSVQGVTADDILVTVNVKGAPSIIEDIESSDVSAYIDLSNYTEGTYEVDVNVEGTDPKISYIVKTKKVKIVIKK